MTKRRHPKESIGISGGTKKARSSSGRSPSSRMNVYEHGGISSRSPPENITRRTSKPTSNSETIGREQEQSQLDKDVSKIWRSPSVRPRSPSADAGRNDSPDGNYQDMSRDDCRMRRTRAQVRYSPPQENHDDEIVPQKPSQRGASRNRAPLPIARPSSAGQDLSVLQVQQQEEI